jgi:hypothetical protein
LHHSVIITPELNRYAAGYVFVWNLPMVKKISFAALVDIDSGKRGPRPRVCTHLPPYGTILYGTTECLGECGR